MRSQISWWSRPAVITTHGYAYAVPRGEGLDLDQEETQPSPPTLASVLRRRGASLPSSNRSHHSFVRGSVFP
ncbi:hypothetical protein CF326_g4061 [Tilletia indica]|nr:hypothetical protein CF326_g4061 [Tilletia indica]